jgi:hypothetical protein
MKPQGGGLRMRRVARLVQVHANDLSGLGSADGWCRTRCCMT